MSTETPHPAAADEQPNKLAGGCVLVIGLGIAGCIAYAVPEIAYYTAGLLTTAGITKTRGWLSQRRERGAETGGDELVEVDIVACLQELSQGEYSVLLTVLADAAGLPNTKAVRALLEQADVPIKRGVRTPGGNGPGVHHTDIPPLDQTPSDECWCRSDANTNTNNATEEEPEEGLRVETIGQGGVIYRDPTETIQRHHATRG